MIQNSTSNILIKYIYGEASALEYATLLEGLYSSNELRKEFEALKTTKKKLSSALMSPPKVILSKIMSHSKAAAKELAR